MESEDDNGDPRQTGNIVANTTVGKIRAMGARVGEGERRGVGAAGGEGSSVVFFYVNVDHFHLPPLTVAS